MSEPVAQLFYGRIFQRYPEVRLMFLGDLRVQGRKFMTMIETVVKFLDEPEQARPALRDLGRRHVDYGVQPEHYDAVMACFIWALGQAIGLNTDTRHAWTELLNQINAEMLAGAAEATIGKDAG